jgi:hypothetical protein
MIAGKLSSFNCPNCNALYQLVSIEVGPETVTRDITCRSCGSSLPGREGKLVLKYFLLRKAGRIQNGKGRSQDVVFSRGQPAPRLRHLQLQVPSFKPRKRNAFARVVETRKSRREHMPCGFRLRACCGRNSKRVFC